MRIAEDLLRPPNLKSKSRDAPSLFVSGPGPPLSSSEVACVKIISACLGEVRGDRVCVSEMVLCGIEVVLGRQGWPSNVGRDI